jgi:sulfur transfer complex TusBCD TusB component (DsrH family)
LLDRGARCVVLDEDLVMRGLRVGEGASAVDYGGLVALLTEPHDRVIGAL